MTARKFFVKTESPLTYHYRVIKLYTQGLLIITQIIDKHTE